MRGIIQQDMFDCTPEIDFSSGCRYFYGNMDNYTKALLSMLKSIKAKLPLMDSMNNTQEFEGLRTITQTLRKMLSNIGAISLAEEAYQLETLLLNDETEQIGDSLIAFSNNLYAFSQNLEELLKKADVNSPVKNNEEQSSFLNYDFTKTKESIKKCSDLLERKII